MLNYVDKLASKVLAVLLGLSLQACSLTPYEHGSVDAGSVKQRAVTQEQGTFVVSASVPSEEEAQQIFGIPIYQRGIQPVWLEITNNSNSRARLILSSIDREYFAPLEVAYMLKKYFSKQGWMDMEAFLVNNAMPWMIDAGETESGFVFTHASKGTKNFNVDIFHTDQVDNFEQFTFFIKVPGFVPDHAQVDFTELYPASAVVATDIDGFKEVLAALPCCTVSQKGDGQGQPVSVALVGEGKNILRALLRAGWSENAYKKDDIYLNNSAYYFGRPQDVAYQKARENIHERNHLRLWMSNIMFEGNPVWMGQISRDIGVRFTARTITTHKVDPNVDETREYLLENLAYAQSIAKFGYVGGVGEVPISQPKGNLTGDPWFSDGYRLVLWVSKEPVPLSEIQFVDWRRPYE